VLRMDQTVALSGALASAAGPRRAGGRAPVATPRPATAPP
jgi:hypothetical protein